MVMLSPLSAGEIGAVATSVLPLTEPDEISTHGFVRLSAEAGGARRWYAFAGRAATRLVGGRSDHDLDVLLSPRLFPREVRADDDLVLDVPTTLEDGSLEGPVRLHINDLALSQAARPMSFPDVDGLVERARDEPATTTRIPRDDLTRALRNLLRTPVGFDPKRTAVPPCFMTVEPGQVSISLDWPGYGHSAITVGAEADGRAQLPIPPAVFQQAVEAAPAEMLLRVPFRTGHSIRLEAPEVGWTSIMLPPTIYPTQAELLEHLQRLLAEDVGQTHVEVDDDGDLPILFEDLRLFARTIDGHPPVAQVFSVVADATEPDEALLRRLNDLNADMRWVRLLWTGGQVLCETEVAHDATAQDLRQACITVATATRMTRGLFNDTAR